MNLDYLNDRQKEAVLTKDGPILILAGAGSGKTKVLTTKIAFLVNTGVCPDNILAITFTNKAANEMKNRVVDLLGNIGYKMCISTFHSFGVNILKKHYDVLGYKENFTILDSDDSLSVIKKIMKDLNIDSTTYNPKAIRNSISSSKNELINSSQFEKYVVSDFDKIVFDVYKNYEKKLLSNNSVDFDDLLFLPIRLFNENPLILQYYQKLFKYILVDEYQDTNEAQYILIKMLGAKWRNVCVVGDESQSIYSFRGSNYRNILNFERDYSDCSTFVLEQNYRSTSIILDSANDVIKNNKNRKEKVLWTDNGVGNKILCYKAYDEKEEANYIVDQINDLIRSGVSRNNISILYRTNAQSRVIEEAFLKSSIPYKVVGSFYFYNRKEIKDLISYLKLIYNTYDDISLQRVINVPKRGIGNKSLELLTNDANNNNISLFEAIKSGKELSFKNMINDIRSKMNSLTLTQLVDLILDKTGYRSELESEKTIESEIRLENLEEFKSITKSFEEKNGVVSLNDFLTEISLVADVTEHKNDNDVVTLMTIHSSKGLEFEYVFLVGMEEGIFPHNNSFFDNESLEEERRLCYVAITRAKKQLWFTYTTKRLLFGKECYNKISRFITEISLENIKFVSSETIVNVVPKSHNIVIDNDATYSIGEKIMHDVFNEGIIIGLDGNVVTIAFAHPHGIKKLLKGHKSIKKI